MNGMELSEAILNRKDNNDESQSLLFIKKPVVVGLTADTCLNVVEKCKNSGMLDVIHKPITVEELRDFFDKRITKYIECNEREQEQHKQEQSKQQNNNSRINP